METPPHGQRLSCKLCNREFLSQKKKSKHLWKKTFDLEEIGGKLNNLLKKEKYGYSCFCGFENMFRNLDSTVTFANIMSKTKAALYHRAVLHRNRDGHCLCQHHPPHFG